MRIVPGKIHAAFREQTFLSTFFSSCIISKYHDKNEYCIGMKYLKYGCFIAIINLQQIQIGYSLERFTTCLVARAIMGQVHIL